MEKSLQKLAKKIGKKIGEKIGEESVEKLVEKSTEKGKGAKEKSGINLFTLGLETEKIKSWEKEGQ